MKDIRNSRAEARTLRLGSVLKSIMIVVGLATLLTGLPGITSRSVARASSPGILQDGSVLASGQSLRSPNGHYYLVMGPDGNLVLSVCGHTLFATWTQDKGARAAMKNGILEVVDPYEGNPIWTRGQAGNPGSYLSVQDDGNLVIYQQSGPPHYLWATMTVTGYTPLCGGSRINPGVSVYSPNGQFVLIMQGDGNLVLYRSSSITPSTWLWNCCIHNHTNNAYASMQANDGNFVVYQQSGPPNYLWASWTQNHQGAYLAVQNDGNVVIYSPGGSPLWSTGTARPPTVSQIESAISWMNANWTGYYRRCEAAANLSYSQGANYPLHAYTSALNDWNAQVAAGRAHPGDTAAPRGAFVFFWKGNYDPTYGHVGISLGNGYYTSTMGTSIAINTPGYLGWSWPMPA